jgi:hypothetical protein
MRITTEHYIGMPSIGREKKQMAKQVSTKIFWKPNLETARKIDDSDTVTAIEAARFRFQASLADLERSYDTEASKLRAAFVAEIAALYSDCEAA